MAICPTNLFNYKGIVSECMRHNYLFYDNLYFFSCDLAKINTGISNLWQSPMRKHLNNFKNNKYSSLRLKIDSEKGTDLRLCLSFVLVKSDPACTDF